MPDWPTLHRELKRKGMTKQLLWEEYTQQYPNHCYSYSQFCDRYRHWCQRQKRSMRQTHKAGEKLFVDYCGPTVPVIDGHTGELREAQIFVAVLGASNYTYAEATWTQGLPDWLGSHARAFEFFGGVPSIVVPDNLRSGVHKACRYDPQLNPSYQQFAEHYRVAVIPARPYKPKDKAKVEVAVQIVERWILARLRHQRFFSLGELNQAIRQLLTSLNQKTFKQLPGNRREWYEQLDRPALKPLPKHPYVYTDIKTARVNVDYHIQYQQHCYSVPHHLVGERVELHADAQLLRLYYQGRLVATHPSSRVPGMTTEPGHMPKRHQRHQQWTPGRLKNWAASLGADVLNWVDEQSQREHPGTYDSLSFEARIALLVDSECQDRETRKQQRLIKAARFKLAASIQDIDYHHPRNLQKTQIASLVNADWVHRGQNLLLTGPCGSGKTYLNCALGHAACLKGYRVRYRRLSRLLNELTQAKAEGTYTKYLRTLTKTQLLIIDDWGLEILKPAHRTDLLEIMDDRYGQTSTLIASQLPTDQWHTSIGDATLADAILDRLMHKTHRIQLKGESMRKSQE